MEQIADCYAAVAAAVIEKLLLSFLDDGSWVGNPKSSDGNH